jgi:hypothetical protein
LFLNVGNGVLDFLDTFVNAAENNVISLRKLRHFRVKEGELIGLRLAVGIMLEG